MAKNQPKGYYISKEDDAFCVYDKNGEKVSQHSTRFEASREVRRLNTEAEQPKKKGPQEDPKAPTEDDEED